MMGVLDFADLCDLAREFNEWVPPERVHAAAPSDAKGDRPGDDFNRRADWADILRPHGWAVERTNGPVTYWRRPDKDRGVSATTGKCHTEGRGDLLFVFTSSAAPLDPDTGYSKLAVYALLNHGGDYAAAARELRAKGYGSSDPADSARVIFGDPPPPGDRPGDDGVTPDPDFATNADLRRMDLGVSWVWDKWLQAKVVNLLAAEGGLGKTRFMADLCRRVHAGLPWPDGTPTPEFDGQYLAMWVAGDRNHGELLTLSETFGFGERICYSGSKAEPLSGVTLNAPSDFGALYRKVKAARPLFLVIDTAGGATGYNLAKQEDARSFFSPLSDLAARLGVCVVVITHLNATKTILGKRAEERVRVVVRMTAADKEPATPRRVEVFKSNAMFPKPVGMLLGEAGNEYSDTPPPKPEDVPGGSGGGRDDDPSKGPPTKVRACVDWLEEFLKAQPRRVFEVRKEAEKAGFLADTLYKARDVLNLIQTETQGYKVWGLRKDD